MAGRVFGRYHRHAAEGPHQFEVEEGPQKVRLSQQPGFQGIVHRDIRHPVNHQVGPKDTHVQGGVHLLNLSLIGGKAKAVYLNQKRAVGGVAALGHIVGQDIQDGIAARDKPRPVGVIDGVGSQHGVLFGFVKGGAAQVAQRFFVQKVATAEAKQ